MVDVFPIVPAHSRSLWLLMLFVLVVVAGVGFVLASTVRGASHSRFEVSSAGIRLRGDVYGRLVPASAVRGDLARVVDLAGTPELVPRRRTFGTSVGGYQSGWFRLRNGEKALLYLTDRSRVVYVPTTAGYSLLLSAQSPQRLVDRLRELGPPSRGSR